MKVGHCSLKGRVVHQEKNLYHVKIDGQTIQVPISGKMRHEAARPSDLPAVGDQVTVEEGRITALFPRRTVLLRKTAGEFGQEQVLASNLETVFYVSSLNEDLNLRRMERYLIMIRDGGIDPVIVLSKADLCSPEQMQEAVRRVESVARDVPVHVTAVNGPESMQGLLPYFRPGETLAFLGSSGVGKSTLVNHFLGAQVQVTQDIAQQRDKGRHTTTSRSLFELPSGAFLLDTPGIREIQLWEGESGVEELFQDIIDLAAGCRFQDCVHDERAQGCQMREALEDGRLDPDRLRSYHKLQKE